MFSLRSRPIYRVSESPMPIEEEAGRVPELLIIIFLFVIYFLYFRSVLLSIVYFISSCHLFLYNTIQTSMPPAGSEPAAPASDRPQILALASAATGIRTRNSSKRASPDLRLRPRGHGSRVPHCPGLNTGNVPTSYAHFCTSFGDLY